MKAYQEFNENSVKEVIAKFDPDIWWGDGGHGTSVANLRKLRPGIVCNNRGNGREGDHVTAEMFEMAEPQYIKKPVVANGWWWEENSIIQKGSWHYDKHLGEEVLPTVNVLFELAKVRCMGGNLLANIGPRPDGQIQKDAYRLFEEMANWMDTNRDSVFGINGGGPWPELSSVPITCRDNVWFFHAKKGDKIELKEIAKKPIAVTLMATGDKIPYEFKSGNLKIMIPENLKSKVATDVVVVEFGSDFDFRPYIFTHW